MAYRVLIANPAPRKKRTRQDFLNSAKVEFSKKKNPASFKKLKNSFTKTKSKQQKSLIVNPSDNYVYSIVEKQGYYDIYLIEGQVLSLLNLSLIGKENSINKAKNKINRLKYKGPIYKIDKNNKISKLRQ